MEIKVLNKSNNPLPEYKTLEAAGMDIRADLKHSFVDSKDCHLFSENGIAHVTIKPLGRVIVPTGLYFDIPTGYEIQVRPRSGLAANAGITVLNTPGTIDAK